MLLAFVAACGGGGGSSPDAAPTPDAPPICNGAPTGVSRARCSTGQPLPQQCSEFTGAYWTPTSVEAACLQDFSAAMPTCPTGGRVGRCLRNCAQGNESVQSFYSDGPTAFTVTLAQSLCAAYDRDAVAPIFLPD